MQRQNVIKHLSLYIMAIGLLVISGCTSLPPITVTTPPPHDFPAEGFSHKTFAQLLKRYVADGRVDYDAWHANNASLIELDSYIAALAAYSPENTPQRFAKENDRKAYWLYAYNALVIKAVLDRWPLDSVTDVKAPLELVKGYGFFYQQQFIVGGKTYNLYDIEHEKVLKGWDDPRAHYVLNCASGSCPVIRPELPTGDALEPFLNKAMHDFLSNPKNITIDHANKKINLSLIFSWYEKDFLNDMHRRGLPVEHGIVDYLINVASAGMKGELEAAVNYTVSYDEYDWDINKTTKSKK